MGRNGHQKEIPCWTLFVCEGPVKFSTTPHSLQNDTWDEYKSGYCFMWLELSTFWYLLPCSTYTSICIGRLSVGASRCTEFMGCKRIFNVFFFSDCKRCVCFAHLVTASTSLKENGFYCPDFCTCIYFRRCCQ